MTHCIAEAPKQPADRALPDCQLARMEPVVRGVASTGIGGASSRLAEQMRVLNRPLATTENRVPSEVGTEPPTPVYVASKLVSVEDSRPSWDGMAPLRLVCDRLIDLSGPRRYRLLGICGMRGAVGANAN